MDNLKQEYLQILEKMKKFEKEYKKKLLFLGLINKYLKKKDSNIIILGGFAVQFYTAGEYLTIDADLACDNRDALNDLLITLNFEKIGRHYFSEDLNLAIEIPTSSISKNQEERLYLIEIEGYEIPILSIEDVIIDRLNAFTHWQSLEDGRLAKELLLIHFNRVDWSYLETQAKEEKVISELLDLKKEIETTREKYEN
ncbi:MAG: hypothetical protein HWN65_01780 [Candidatus Helarchaeota archaeon]|nr:hypothetical protein [Candidatus Helarchaeota archaeon]